MGKLEVFNKLLHKKGDLLQCIFSTLIFQTLTTIVVFRYIYQNPKSNLNIFHENSIINILIFLFIQFALLYAMIAVDISFAMRFILFIVFSIVQGLLLGAGMVHMNRDVIMSALVSTLAIFVIFLGLGIFIVYLGIDLGWMGVYLLFGLLGLIIVNITNMIIKPGDTTSKYTTVFGMLLFSIFILYDTNNILLKYGESKIFCIRGALDYYLDIINLFTQAIDIN